jgi:flavin-dependent thymidylate synthase
MIVPSKSRYFASPATVLGAARAVRVGARRVRPLQREHPELSRTDRRKMARQAARSVLPNATETKIFVTVNARALRHFLFLRGTVHAEDEIRNVAIEMWKIALKECPGFFNDFELRKENGIDVLWTAHPKV